MALILKNGSIFLHIPKTGGNWVTHVLRKMNLIHSEVGQKHSDAARTIHAISTLRPASFSEFFLRKPIKSRLPTESIFIFTFVRNPISWYESWFKYQSQDSRKWCYFGTEGKITDWHPNAILNGLGHSDFNVFVKNVINKRPGYVSELMFSYTTSEVSFIGKQESIREDLCNALSMANEKYNEDLIMSEKPFGVSMPLSSRINWNEKLKKEVIKLEWPSIVRFGYK